jgi:hypothetical protein
MKHVSKSALALILTLGSLSTPARAYSRLSPYYGYAGWEDYSTRNGIACAPGTMTKLGDGRDYMCQ